MTIAVDLGRIATKQTNKTICICLAETQLFMKAYTCTALRIGK